MSISVRTWQGVSVRSRCAAMNSFIKGVTPVGPWPVLPNEEAARIGGT